MTKQAISPGALTEALHSAFDNLDAALTPARVPDLDDRNAIREAVDRLEDAVRRALQDAWARP